MCLSVCLCLWDSSETSKSICVETDMCVGVGMRVCVLLSAQDNTEKFSCHRRRDMISSSSYWLHYEAPRDCLADVTDSRNKKAKYLS